MRFLFTGSLLFLFQGIGKAEEAFSLTSGNGYHYWKDFVNMLITLLCVLAFILLTVWFLKKIMRSRMRTLNRSTAIKILERRPLTQKSSLYLVSVLGKGVVIAESSAGIQLITELGNETDIEILLSEKLEEPPSPSFTQLLQKKMKEMINKGS